MIESFKSFARKSPLIAGALIGAVAVGILFLIGSLLTGPSTEFGSAATILKEDYLRLAIDEFAQSGDGARARWRYERLGSEGPGLLTLLKNDLLTDPATLLNFARAVGDDVLIAAEPAAAPRPANGGFSVIGWILTLLVLILAAGFVYLFLTDPKRKASADALRAKLEKVFSRFYRKSAPRGDRRPDPEAPSINYRENPFKLQDYPPTPSTAAQGIPPVKNAASVVAEEPSPRGGSRSAAASLPEDAMPELTDVTDTLASQTAETAVRSTAGASAAFFQDVREERRAARRTDNGSVTSVGSSSASPDIPEFLKGEEAALSEPETAAADDPDFYAEDRLPADQLHSKPDHESFAFYEPPRPVLAGVPEPEPESGDEADAGFSPACNDAMIDDQIADDDNQDSDVPNDDFLEDAGSGDEAEPFAADMQREVGRGEELPPWEDSPAAGAQAIDAIEFKLENRESGAADGREPALEAKSDPVEPAPSVGSEDDSLQHDGGESLPESVPEPIHVVRSDNLNLPLVHYKAVYRLGDDLFDETFSIDEMDDEFIGECGIGIAETINSTEPKAVTAFEAWLFDRQDTMTPTFFMLSEYAYQQPEMLERLKNKGQYGLMEVGQSYVIETFALKMTLTILEIVYGTESSDPKSYFDRVVFDVEVVRR